MTFGKFAGLELKEIPLSYLQWLAELDDLREPLKSAVEAERARRAGQHGEDFSQPSDFQLSIADRQTARRIVEAGRRALARVEHPDRGGSLVVMQKINFVADALLEALR